MAAVTVIKGFGSCARKKAHGCYRRGAWVERAKQLARALKCHPAVLVFPGWEESERIAG